MAKEDLIIDELDRPEKELLLRAFDYDIDEEGYIIDLSGTKIQSNENPDEFLHVDRGALASGSLNLLDGSPTSISKFLRERMEGEQNDSSR